MTEFGTGIAKADDGQEAAEQAAADAINSMDSDTADFAAVFCSPEYDYEPVVDTVKDVSGASRLIGCSSAGEFTHESVDSGTVTVALIQSNDMQFFTAMGHGIGDDLMGAVQEATADLPNDVDGYPHLVGINLHEGLAGKGEEVAMAAHQEMNRIPFSGGSAGDDMAFEETRVFTENEISSDAVALAVIASKKPFALAVDHGHSPISPPFEVTKSEGSTVHELDGRTAYEVWKEQIRRDAKARYDIDVNEVGPNDKELGFLLTRYEFGLETEAGNYKVRWPGPTAKMHGTDGPLEFACGIPEGVVFRIVHATDQDEIDSQRKAGLEARERMGDQAAAGALMFDCVCHKAILEDDFHKAVEAAYDALQVPLAGFETYGEVCLREGDLSGFHNTTTSILMIPK